MPASFSGIVGHKPTHGLVPYTGAFPIEQTLDHLGPMTRTVADAALVLDVIAGPDGLDPRQPRDLVRAGLPRDDRPGPQPGCGSAWWPRASAHPELRRPVSTRPSAAPSTSCASAGCSCEDVSRYPGTATATQIWDVIAAEGATAQMVDGNAYGSELARPGTTLR